ncbi:MAG: hypothetical protein MUC42_14175 [Bryobacter sp.]|jgi:hypothetical protein|nr:hypothetical protein [Bryobacter sp.]
MRILTAAAFAAALGGCLAEAGDPLEVSTGFLIGPRYDAHLFYVKADGSGAWRKSYQEANYRKEAQGRLLGVNLGGLDAPVDALREGGFNFARLELQSDQWTIFTPAGGLDSRALGRFGRLLDETARAGIAVELVLFNPARDQDFDSPDAILESAKNLTDWLIDKNHRHVLLNPANQWHVPGWDYDHFVPQNLERISTVIRERFHERRTDYALPIAISAPMSGTMNPRLVEQSDVLVAAGTGADVDPRSVERPIVVERDDPRGCAAMFARFAGCLVSRPAGKDGLAPLGSLVLKAFK